MWLLTEIVPFLGIFGTKNKEVGNKISKEYRLLIANVYQENQSYEMFLDVINQFDPDFFLTVETNMVWQEALQKLKSAYPHSIEVPQENTYGMHFYSRYPIESAEVNYFVADDLPSIEAVVELDKNKFRFFGIHPPPPSPTEEETSKERDAEIAALSKRIEQLNDGGHFMVAGDFNNVAWARSTEIFRKATGFIDPRKGRGFISTFPANYPLLRVPIDLVYHSANIRAIEVKTLPSINSDHLPLFFSFYLTDSSEKQRVEQLNNAEANEREEMIQEGREEKSANRT